MGPNLPRRRYARAAFSRFLGESRFNLGEVGDCDDVDVDVVFLECVDQVSTAGCLMLDSGCESASR